MSQTDSDEDVMIAAAFVGDAHLIAAAPDLLEAAELLEKVEHERQFCDECEGQGEPEACGFPLWT